MNDDGDDDDAVVVDSVTSLCVSSPRPCGTMGSFLCDNDGPQVGSNGGWPCVRLQRAGSH